MLSGVHHCPGSRFNVYRYRRGMSLPPAMARRTQSIKLFATMSGLFFHAAASRPTY
ncbi:uncharacterized protein ANIA_11583 [Aspergillus nidulans FGSC A4]|uniref:Uncharacterized protein n=1 Tax=Emericella nidulans (strain FGSC A4 / ATCC 38163 / CBS 112.46 / NRRL 194 / M139) TaxID=227321 RepID=C8V4J4_EMENI|nr:hypothetical protein [Aspergillus nidulans FGSC A4]CBF73477.1 TPA: hypothetical protein ANIA_11583 [Aspergillus nidulans FGSC A4]